MKLKELIAIADAGYPDGLIMQAFDEGASIGDGLAEFIMRELRDLFWSGPDSELLADAVRAMGVALRELGSVQSALNDCLEIAGTPKKELPLLIGQFENRPELQAYLEKRLKQCRSKP